MNVPKGIHVYFFHQFYIFKVYYCYILLFLKERIKMSQCFFFPGTDVPTFLYHSESYFFIVCAVKEFLSSVHSLRKMVRLAEAAAGLGILRRASLTAPACSHSSTILSSLLLIYFGLHNSQLLYHHLFSFLHQWAVFMHVC